jgi:dihydroorotate dehydrogenase (fumarate)
MRAAPRLTLSTPDEIRLSLRWIAILYGQVRASLAATSGVHFADDVVKLVLAGADAVMVASTLYRRGLQTLPTLISGVQTWLEANDYTSLDQVRGCLSQRKCPDPAVFQRANYFRALSTFVDQTV